jgi:tRNA(Ile)-lysidine synthase
LRRAGALAAADDAVLERRAGAVPIRLSGGEASLPAASLVMLPEAVAGRVVRRALRSLTGPYAGTSRDVSEALAAVSGSGSRSLSGGLLAGREGPWLVIRLPERAGRPPGPTRLAVPGETRFGDWIVDVRVAAAIPSPLPIGRRHAVLAVAEELVVRGALPGDTLPVRGAHKRVVDVLREAGVPARLRPRWPVVLSDGRMAWVVGARVADAAGAGAGPVLVLTARDATVERA